MRSVAAQARYSSYWSTIDASWNLIAMRVGRETVAARDGGFLLELLDSIVARIDGL